MLSSKTLSKVMLGMATAGMVVASLMLVTPPATPTASASEVSPSITNPFLTLTPDAPEHVELADDDRSEPPTPQDTTPSEETATTQDVIALPEVSFSAPLSETHTVDGVVTPPDFDHAFRVTDVAAQIYVTHSCRYEQCLGNSLFNLNTGEVFAKAGQTLWLNGEHYEVTEVRTVDKDALPYDAVWETDGVAVITCFQNKDLTPSTQNLVVIAQPADIS